MGALAVVVSTVIPNHQSGVPQGKLHGYGLQVVLRGISFSSVRGPISKAYIRDQIRPGQDAL